MMEPPVTARHIEVDEPATRNWYDICVSNYQWFLDFTSSFIQTQRITGTIALSHIGMSKMAL